MGSAWEGENNQISKTGVPDQLEIRVEGAELLVGVEEIDVRVEVVFSTQFDVDMKEEERTVGK